MSKGLVYVSDQERGLRREKRRGHFVYHGARGPVKSPATLARIRRLAIPPAYSEVWICAKPNGHIQATGRDAKGRKQYRYHADWRNVRDAAKFDRLIAFSEGLPRLRRRMAADLRRPGLPREKVVAAVVFLLQHSLIRIGNEEYAQSNHSYGLTTLRNRHVGVLGQKIEFKFRGKSGRFHAVRLSDARVARVVRRCQEVPGQNLFQYLDEDGETQRVGSGDVNVYLRASLGDGFSAKDFRTWAATVLAAKYLSVTPSTNAVSPEREVVEYVAKRLGNTPAVCRKAYIHPGVFEAYADGLLKMPPASTRTIGATSLSACERVVSQLLKRKAKNGRWCGPARPTP